MTDGSPTSAAMIAAAERLSTEFANRNRVHLNEVFETVFVSHCRQPVAAILTVLMRQATTEIYEPTEQALQPAARAISVGRRFAFV